MMTPAPLAVLVVLCGAALCASLLHPATSPFTLIHAPRAPAAAGDEAAKALLSSMKAEVPRWALTPTLHTQPRWRDVAVDTTPAMWHSQWEEDQHLFNTYFHNMHHGFYLEMGALDGMTLSNTKFFSDALGWRGLLIEPSPIQYDRLTRNRPGDLCVRAAICSHQGTVHYIMSSKKTNSPADGIYDFMSETFKKKWHPSREAAQADGRLIAMPCVPLQSLFDHYHINTIDFWSLDVEGAELEVLKTVNFTSVHVSVILIESDGTNLVKEASIRTLLQSNNFTSHGMLSRSEWFVHNLFRPHARNDTHLPPQAGARV